VEQAKLRRLRVACFTQHLTKKEMPQGGAAEAFGLGSISVPSMWVRDA